MSKYSIMDKFKYYIKIGSLQEVKCFINREDLKFDAEELDYFLLKSSLLHKHKEIAKLLIEHNFRVNKNSLFERDQTPLHLAIKWGWKDIIELLLLKGASVTIQESTSNLTPIQLSFHMQSYEISDLMLLYDKDKASFDSGPAILSHLHIAAARNCVTAIKQYLRLGIDVNLSVSEDHISWPGFTPLHFAVKFQNREAVEFLLKCGANFTISDDRGNTPLHLAAMIQDQWLVDLFLTEQKYTSENPKNRDGLSHFHIACARNDVSNVYGFLQCGVDINSKVSKSAQMFRECTALHIAITNQCTDVVKLLLASGASTSKDMLLEVYKTKKPDVINLFFTGIYGTSHSLHNQNVSPLLKACLWKQKKEIKQLINSGVTSVNDRLPADAPRWPGATALHILIDQEINTKDKGIIELILKKGADIAAVDARGKTPLLIAFEKNRDMVELILKRYIKVNTDLITDKDGLSPFHIVCTTSNLNVVDKFLSAGADINLAVSNNSFRFPGYTPLHMAVNYKKFTMILKLLSHGADITIKDGFGLTAFDLLLQSWDPNDWDINKFYKIIKLFLNAAGKICSDTFHSHGFTLLHTLCVIRTRAAIESCIDRQTINAAVDRECQLDPGYTALHLAVLHGTDKIVRTLLDCNADPSMRTADGFTAFHLALQLPSEDEQDNEDKFYTWKDRYLDKDVDDGQDDVDEDYEHAYEDYIRDSLMRTRDESDADHSDDNEDHVLRAHDDRLVLLDENPFDSNGFSHFYVACHLGMTEAVRSFLDRGVDVDLKTKLPGGQPRSKSVAARVGETGLHAAVRARNIKLVRLLLERGADVNARDLFMRTPLHKALDCDVELVRTLLEQGADVNARDCAGDTFLHKIRRKGARCRLFHELLVHGADVNIENKAGKTALAVRFRSSHSKRRRGGFWLVLHTLALIGAGCRVSAANWRLCRLKLKHSYGQIFKKMGYWSRWKSELEQMDFVKLNEAVSLHYVLREDASKLRRLVNTKTFRQVFVVEKAKLVRNFPMYEYLLKLQYSRGIESRRLFTEAASNLRMLVGPSRVSYEGAEAILEYLSDEEIASVTRAAKA